MGLGGAALQTLQKKEPVPQPGPPFTSDSANNGLSVDSVTGKIVLGNDQGDVQGPAELLTFREIATNGNEVTLVDRKLNPAVRLQILDSYLVMTNLVTNATIFMQLNGSSPQFQAVAPAGFDASWSVANNQSGVASQSNGAQPYSEWVNPTIDFRVQLVAGVLRIRSNAATGNGLNLDDGTNDVQSTGTLSTANPGSGAGKWKLGTVVAGAVVPDPNNYVEVDIGGSIVKLIKAT